ncbi:MAG: class I SAM-dependent methyltransferase [Desulfamplus sp.]|nr:class I SAM-dependent methyltransferase [Desulfamplus sp.]
MEEYANASDYEGARNVLYIEYVDDYTFFKLIGDVTDKAVLDIGCGLGEHTRKLRQMGAAKVVGMDLTPDLIELARQKESACPLGIEYIQKDMCNPSVVGIFDLVVAFSVLSQAPTREHLLRACQMAAGNLKSGGRFIAVGLNPEQNPETYPLCEKYGFKVSLSGNLTEGAMITSNLHIDGNDLIFKDYYMSHAIYEWALRTAGFQVIRWHSPLVSPEGVRQFGSEFWQDFIQCQMSLYIECVK